MLKPVVLPLLMLACVFASGILPSSGQSTPAATNAASTNAPAAAPPAIALGDVVTQAQAAMAELQKYKDGLASDPTLQGVTDQLPELKTQIGDRTLEDKRMLEAAPSLSALQTAQATWQTISESLATAQKNLSQRVRTFDEILGQLDEMDVSWQATLAAAGRTGAPPEIVQTVKSVRATIADTNKAVKASLLPFYAMQNQVAAQDKLAQAGLDTVQKAINAGWAELFQRNHPPLWDPESLDRSASGLLVQEKSTFSAQAEALQNYLQAKTGAILIQLLLLVLLVMGFFWTRDHLRSRAKEEPVLLHAGRIFDLPVPTALLLALLGSWFLYPYPPRLLWAVVGATALIPAVIVTRRLIDPASFPILYATMIAYLVDQVRYVVTPAGILSRMLFIAELLAVLIFILVTFRSRHLCDTDGEASRLKRLTRFYLHVTFLVLVAAGFANVLGYVPLSIQAGDGMLNCSYLAVVLYAAVRIGDAVAISALCIRPLSGFGMVRRHRDLIYGNITIVIRWVYFAIWIVAALKIFFLYDVLWTEGSRLLVKDHQWGSLDFNLGSILAFPLTIWAAFLLSRLIRFTLEEELYPHLQLSRGIPYAASTMVHYAILVVGFFIAVKAGGADLSQFSFLAGAFGVGLGFGLQNIFNNFISGIILLFERPIKVGDDIQIDATTMGRVERIGIRASVILLTNGSEMIVPNGNLISNPVTNWTLSNCERLIEIPVNITSKVEPGQIIDLLTKVTAAHPHVLKNPAPHTILVTLGATMNFRIRAWIDSEEEWLKIISELSITINTALLKENITIA